DGVHACQDATLEAPPGAGVEPVDEASPHRLPPGSFGRGVRGRIGLDENTRSSHARERVEVVAHDGVEDDEEIWLPAVAELPKRGAKAAVGDVVRPQRPSEQESRARAEAANDA